MSDLALTDLLLDPFADDIVPDLPLETLKKDLADLIRRYVRGGRSRQLAKRVIGHCQALYLHPALGGHPEEQHAFQDLAQHWRRLAAQMDSAATAN